MVYRHIDRGFKPGCTGTIGQMYNCCLPNAGTIIDEPAASVLDEQAIVYPAVHIHTGAHCFCTILKTELCFITFYALCVDF